MNDVKGENDSAFDKPGCRLPTGMRVFRTQLSTFIGRCREDTARAPRDFVQVSLKLAPGSLETRLRSILRRLSRIDEEPISHSVEEPAAHGAWVETKGGNTYIVDQHGERWDVTQAKSIRFIPSRFQYDIGRHAFTPLDESAFADNPDYIHRSLRIIGVAASGAAHAYSTPSLPGTVPGYRVVEMGTGFPQLPNHEMRL